MANIFDQFDTEGQQPSNIFDQFDAPSQPASNIFDQFDAQGGGRSRWEIMWDAARIGFKDTIRGVQQISGINEQELDEEQKYLDNLLADPEYGGWAKAAYFAGLIADPAGWLLPVAKLRTASKIGELVMPGAVGGGIAGGLSYIPEGESRAETAALGAGLGAAVGPVAMAAKKAYEPVGDAVWKVMRQPEGAGAIAGGGLGLYNADENAPIQEKMLNAIQMALVGGATGFGLKKLDKSMDGALARAIIPDYDLADAWINARSKFKGSRQIAAGEFEKITQKMAELPIEQRKILYGMLTDKDAFRDKNNKALKGLAQEARDTINKYSEQLIDIGVLTRKTYEENKDTYIHRVYNDPDRIKGTAQQRIQIAGDELYLRGNVKEMPLSEWNKGDRPDNLPGWEVVKKVEYGVGKGAPRVTVRRDWTENERLQMGEIKDVMVSFDRTGRLLANDVSALRFFKEMADNPEIAIKKQEDAPSNWVKVDDNRAYGALRDMYVSKATLADLKAIRELNTASQLKRFSPFDKYRKLNRLWKGSKTIANPAVHFNNFTSNIIHYDFANGNVKDFFKAIKDIKWKSDDFVQAQERGVFGGFFGSEVARDAMPLVEMYSEKAGIKDNMMLARGGIEYASKVAAAAGKAKKYTWDAAAKLYNLEDQVFRMALYRTERDRLIKSGLGKDDAMDMAARKAREWFVDYERNSPVLEALREGPLPFASYMYGVVPKLAETAAKKPIKFAKWGLLFAGLNELGEQDETQRSLIEKEYPTMFGIPGMPSVMTKLPEAISPQTRDDWYLNIGRSLPGGNIFGVEDLQVGRVPGLPESLQPSFGAGGGILDALTGINRFTGQTNANLEQRASDLARQFIPNLPISGFPSYSGERIERALSGKYSPTRDVYTPTTAIMSGLGMKVQPVSTRKLKRRMSAEFKSKKRNIQSTRKKAYRDFLSGQIDELEWEEAKKQYTEDLKKLRRSR